MWPRIGRQARARLCLCSIEPSARLSAAIALDYLAIAIAELGAISERRTMRLTDESSNVRELPAFLTTHGGVNSGFMIVQVWAGSALRVVTAELLTAPCDA